MATRLNAAGLSDAKGSALNVSNFYTTEESLAYANSVNAALAQQFGYTKPFAVDTSRNGNGSDGQWCNPPGRKIGARTDAASDTMLPVWIKVPGDPDGACGSAPTSPPGRSVRSWRSVLSMATEPAPLSIPRGDCGSIAAHQVTHETCRPTVLLLQAPGPDRLPR
jgi:cellulase/cellobiase CelA1